MVSKILLVVLRKGKTKKGNILPAKRDIVMQGQQ